MLVNGLVILFNGIPLVDCNDNALAALMCDPGDLGILLCHALGRIDHHDHNICLFYGSNSANDTKSLQFFLDLALAAQSCRVDKDIFLAMELDLGIDRISGGSCHIGNNHTVLAHQTVDKG